MSNLAARSPAGAVAPLAEPLVRSRRLDVRPVAWALLLAGALFVLDFAGWYGYITDQPIRIATQVLTYAVVGGWLLLAILRPRWLPRTPLVAPVVAASAAFALAALFSQRQRLSAESALIGLGSAALFLFLSRLAAEPWFRARLRVILILVPVAVAVAYIVQVALTWVEWWGLIGALSVPPLRPAWDGLTFGSPNLVATVLMLTGPLCIALVGERHRRMAITLGVLFVIAIVLSGSRSALVGLGLAGLVGLSVLLHRRGGLRALTSGRLAIASSVVVVGGLVVAVPIIAFRFAQGGELLRLDLWRSALSMFVAHPLFGSGPGTWVQLKFAANPSGAANLVLPHAHDLFIQTIAEVGIVGSIFLVVLAVAVIRRLLAAARSSQPALSRQAMAVLLALVAFAGQSLTDNMVNLPAVLLLLLGVVAWVDGGLEVGTQAEAALPGRMGDPGSARSPIPGHGLGRLVAGVALLGLLISAVPLAGFDRAALAADDGNRAAALGDWATAEARYQDAAALDPGMTLYQLEMAVALARDGRSAEARPILEAAAQQDQLPNNWISLASLEAAAGDCVTALQHAALGVERGPDDAGIALNAGAVAERCDAPDNAEDWYAAALVAAPPLAADPYWHAAARASSWSAVVTEARGLAKAGGDPAGAAMISAYSGDRQTAATELAALPTPCITCGAEVRYLAGDQAGATAMLVDQLNTHPLDWTTAATLARYAYFAGDTTAAIKYQRMAEIVQGDAAPYTVTAPNRIEVDAPGGQLLPSSYPWAVYLRNGPTDFWMPGLLTPVFAR